MSSGYLDFHDVNALARQAVDLLVPEAHLDIEQSPRSNAYVYPQATGGDPGNWRITVTIAPDNSSVLTVEPQWPPALALANLLLELAAATHGEFRGRPFPECPGHSHPAGVDVAGDLVVLRCPADAHAVATLVPARPEQSD